MMGSGLIQPERSKVQGVESFPTPPTKKHVQCFLGMTGYYRKFIPDYASIAEPLTDLTKNAAPNQARAHFRSSRVYCVENLSCLALISLKSSFCKLTPQMWV